MPHVEYPTELLRWLFAGRFVVLILGIVLIIGSLRDLNEWRTGKGPRVYWAYHVTVLMVAFAFIFTSPFNLQVLRRVLGITMTPWLSGLMVLGGTIFCVVAFLASQVTRAYNRGVPLRRVKVGFATSCVGIILLTVIGVGIDVRFP